MDNAREIQRLLNQFDSYLMSALREPTDKNISVYEHWIDFQYDVDKLLKAGSKEWTVTFPCKPGDTIWWLNGKFLMNCDVVDFCVDVDGLSLIHVQYHDEETNKVYGHNLVASEIGKTVFLQEEDAKQRLKEMGCLDD